MVEFERFVSDLEEILEEGGYTVYTEPSDKLPKPYETIYLILDEIQINLISIKSYELLVNVSLIFGSSPDTETTKQIDRIIYEIKKIINLIESDDVMSNKLKFVDCSIDLNGITYIVRINYMFRDIMEV